MYKPLRCEPTDWGRVVRAGEVASDRNVGGADWNRNKNSTRSTTVRNA